MALLSNGLQWPAHVADVGFERMAAYRQTSEATLERIGSCLWRQADVTDRRESSPSKEGPERQWSIPITAADHFSLPYLTIVVEDTRE